MQQKKLPQDQPRPAPKRRIGLFLASITLLMLPLFAVAETPDVGSKAPDFTLSTPEGAPVRLSDLIAKNKVVLVVLRGYPGYQCPYCQRQVHDFQVNADKFSAKGIQLLLVYPGPPADLEKRAQEFLAKEGPLPANFHLVIDPDYKFTNQYGLRWDAPHETAYPSTFLIDQQGIITSRKISHTHGDRTSADDVLADLAKTK
jgi:peroxiredoxin